MPETDVTCTCEGVRWTVKVDGRIVYQGSDRDSIWQAASIANRYAGNAGY